MDSETFQIITLALLGVTLLFLLIVLLAMSRLGRRIRDLSAPGAQILEPASPVASREERPEQAAETPRTEEQPAVQQTEAPVEASPAAQEDPQEQPFERDGRWWFRRGDELLVYDEQTGQWEPANGASSPAEAAETAEPQATAGATAPGAAPASTQTETGRSEAGEPQTPAAGSFWKCPSCGAINGSTATSCRMCFTPRA